MVARVGGDEFTVILTSNIGIKEAQHIAENILKKINQTVKLNHKTMHITASIGIAISSIQKNTSNRLLKSADHAMYVAKNRGGDQWAV